MSSSAPGLNFMYQGDFSLTTALVDADEALAALDLTGGFVGPSDEVATESAAADLEESGDLGQHPLFACHEFRRLRVNHAPLTFRYSGLPGTEPRACSSQIQPAAGKPLPAETGAGEQDPQRYLNVIRRICSSDPKNRIFFDQYLDRLMVLNADCSHLSGEGSRTILPLDEETAALVRMGPAAIPEIIAAMMRDLRSGNERLTRCLVRVLRRIGSDASPAVPLLRGLINIYIFASEEKELSDLLIRETLKAFGSICFAEGDAKISAAAAATIPSLLSLIETRSFERIVDYRHVLPAEVWDRKNPKPERFSPGYRFARRERLLTECSMSMAELALNAILNMAPWLISEVNDEIDGIVKRHRNQIAEDRHVTYFRRHRHLAPAAALEVRGDFCAWLRNRVNAIYGIIPA